MDRAIGTADKTPQSAVSESLGVLVQELDLLHKAEAEDLHAAIALLEQRLTNVLGSPTADEKTPGVDVPKRPATCALDDVIGSATVRVTLARISTRSAQTKLQALMDRLRI
jgi:hypothetical protein